MSTPIYLIGKDRFLREVKIHKKLTPHKVVNWYVDERGINMFLNATNSSEIYCYIHNSEIPPSIQELITAEGEILGIYEKEEKQVEDIFGTKVIIE